MAEAPREVAHYLAAAAVSAGFLSHPLWFCPDHQLCRHRGAGAALHRHSIRQPRLAHPSHAQSRQLQVLVQRRSLWSFVPLFAEDGIFLHPHLSRHRLSDGLRHRADLQEHAKHPAADHHPAVLDLVPAARVRTRGDHSRDRTAQYRPPVAGRNRPPAADHAHDLRGVPRNHLFLPAFHGPAAVRDARETRSFLAGSGR